ncbi:MAG: Hpt domain-containing protein [Vulcanimicrobiota bacterium]
MAYRIPEQEILDSLDQDRALFYDLIDCFLENAPEQLVEVERALNSRDSARSRLEAHSLKGSLAIFCAPDVVRLAHEVEQLARRGAIDRALDIMPRLRYETYSLLDELRRYRGSVAA